MHHLSKFWCFVFFLFFDDETWLGWNAPSLQANEPWIWLSLSFSLQVNLERVHNQTYLSCSQRIVRKYVNSQGKGTRHTASKPCCHWNLGTVHLLVRKDKDEPFISRLDKGFAWYIYIYIPKQVASMTVKAVRCHMWQALCHTFLLPESHNRLRMNDIWRIGTPDSTYDEKLDFSCLLWLQVDHL